MLHSTPPLPTPITMGGTNAITASAARTNLGLAIGSDIQASDATLTALAAADWAANALPIGTGANTLSQTSFAANTFPARASTGNLVAKSITDFILSLLDDADASTARTTLGFADGIYTPTLTDVSNISSHGTVSDLTYLRIGNSCTVSGRVAIDPTSSSSATELGISLPFASNFSLFTDCAGGASASFGGVVSQSCGIRADTTNDRAALIFTSTADVTARDWEIQFTYRII